MIDVTAAVLIHDDKILLARRKPGKRLAGKWEFPGGKITPPETPAECLKRELTEEFSIETAIGPFICESTHDDGQLPIRLLAYQTKWLSGQFQLHDHDSIAWATLNNLLEYDLCPADIPIAQFLQNHWRHASMLTRMAE